MTGRNGEVVSFAIVEATNTQVAIAEVKGPEGHPLEGERIKVYDHSCENFLDEPPEVLRYRQGEAMCFDGEWEIVMLCCLD